MYHRFRILPRPTRLPGKRMRVEQVAGSRSWKRPEAPRQRLRLLGTRSPARLRLIFFSLSFLLLSRPWQTTNSLTFAHCVDRSNTFSDGSRLLQSMSEEIGKALC